MDFAIGKNSGENNQSFSLVTVLLMYTLIEIHTQKVNLIITIYKIHTVRAPVFGTLNNAISNFQT